MFRKSYFKSCALIIIINGPAVDVNCIIPNQTDRHIDARGENDQICVRTQKRNTFYLNNIDCVGAMVCDVCIFLLNFFEWPD